MTETTVYTTLDGVEITPELRVFTNDWQWGTVLPEQFTRGGLCYPGGEFFDGWFHVRLDDGAVRLYNSERMTSRPPAGAPRDDRGGPQ